MSDYILSAGQTPGNEKKTYVENNVEIPQIKAPDNQRLPQNVINIKTNPDITNNWDVITPYLSFSNAQKIIQQLLTCSRIILQPALTPNFTVSELAAKLNIKPAQLSCLRRSPAFYKQMAKFINLPLASLYCSCKLLPHKPPSLPYERK